jgi:hypothetical protein
MVFAINPGAEGSNNSFSLYQANALAVGAQLANATNATTATSSSNPSSTGIGGSKSGGAISLNINAMLMTGLGMVVSLVV